MSGWKPGDVALGLGKYAKGRLLIRAYDETWMDLDGERYEDSLDVRPLVVIDPEDAEQVGRLYKELFFRTGIGWSEFGRTQAALRQFAAPTPPKPDQPTLVAAVVADEHGQVWARDGLRQWRCLTHDLPPASWSEFGPGVRVLSEGVTP